jgi:hypothetical protein
MRSDWKVLRWTGAFGIAAFILILVAQPLWLVSGTAPRLDDTAAFTDFITKNHSIILSRSLVDILIIASFLVFLAGFCHLIRQARAHFEWAASLIFAGGLAWAILVIFGDTLCAATALDTIDKADPATVRALWEASIPAFGAVGLILCALFLASSGFAILSAGALPGWTGWLAFVAALVNLVVTPSIYAGANVSGFYTADGLATVAGLLPLLIWLFIVSIFMVARRKPEPAIVPTSAERERQESRP